MTNKPILSVERDLIERAVQAIINTSQMQPAINELRALLDKPALNTDVRTILLDVVPGDGSGFEVYAKSCADVEAMLSLQSQRIEDLELSQHQGEQVAFDDWFRREIGDPNEVNCKGVESRDVYVARKAWDFRQPALVVPFKPDTVVCRRYTLEGHIFYHYDLEPVYGSVPVTLSDLIFMAEGKPVSVVMPLVMPETRAQGHDMGGNYDEGYADGWNMCLAEVARLNGVKP